MPFSFNVEMLHLLIPLLPLGMRGRQCRAVHGAQLPELWGGSAAVQAAGGTPEGNEAAHPGQQVETVQKQRNSVSKWPGKDNICKKPPQKFSFSLSNAGATWSGPWLEGSPAEGQGAWESEVKEELVTCCCPEIRLDSCEET